MTSNSTIPSAATDTSTVGANATNTTTNLIDEVVMHPLVLLSAADHYHRVARGTRKRVVGVLLGQYYKGKIDATNSFAIPFEEDSRNPSVFYLDHNYLENMLYMFKKVNAKERVVGFYSTGPQIRSNDLRIYDIIERYVGATNTIIPAVFCIIDIRPDRPDLPVTSYCVTEEVSSFASGIVTAAATTGGAGGAATGGGNTTTNNNNRQVTRTFAHVSSSVGALEAEEIGVEHLLRDINDPTVSTVASLIKSKLGGLATLGEKLIECKVYLENCASGKCTANSEILSNLQTIISLLPNLNNPQLVRSMMLKTNDMYMSIYLASLIRSIIALHDLVNNKIQYGEDGTEIVPASKTTSTTPSTTTDGEEKKDEKGDTTPSTTKKSDSKK